MRFWGAVALALATALACGSPPKEGRKKDVLLVSAAVDREVGTDVAAQIEQSMGFVSSPSVQSYVDTIGQRVARDAPRHGFTYEFRVLDQDAPNAFALPGGYVYVSRGLMLLANSEDEVANVLGHEVIHVDSRHAAARQLIAQQALNPLMLPGIVLGTVFGSKVGKATTEPLRGFSAPYVASYSRDQERSADRGGQSLAASAGYDPNALATFLQDLAEAERYRLGYSRLPSYMDSHPGTRERVGSAGAQAGLLTWTPRPGVAGGRDAYLHKLEGLTVGQSPSEGVFRGTRFFHPDLNFSLKFPRGWRVANTDTAVGAVSPRRDVQIFMNVPEKGTDPFAAGEEFISKYQRKLGLSIHHRGSIKLGDLDAYRIEASAQMSHMRVNTQLTWIAYNGRIYQLNAAAPSGVGTNFIGLANNTARSFRPLTAEERNSFKILRLRLVPAQGGESIAALSERSGNALPIPWTAIINGQGSSQPLAQGQVVKIARAEPYQPSGN